ncbi:MAG: hypothetical protein WBC05_09940 [Sedimentisphaerales bacterium]
MNDYLSGICHSLSILILSFHIDCPVIPKPVKECKSSILCLSILSVVVFDGDGIVEANDLLMPIESSGTNDMQYDIDLTLFGDEIVDVQDLVVRVENLFEECPSVEPNE